MERKHARWIRDYYLNFVHHIPSRSLGAINTITLSMRRYIGHKQSPPHSGQSYITFVITYKVEIDGKMRNFQNTDTE